MLEKYKINGTKGAVRKCLLMGTKFLKFLNYFVFIKKKMPRKRTWEFGNVGLEYYYIKNIHRIYSQPSSQFFSRKP